MSLERHEIVLRVTFLSSEEGANVVATAVEIALRKLLAAAFADGRLHEPYVEIPRVLGVQSDVLAGTDAREETT